ncbi:hypothetical protein LCGC14_0343170 [marine sediment metagenome]|uniref:Uncharacterized protein n=1 Tax=marine sediment metagenome TaxID=412755 RepID=A0A0F9TIP0_9ZZZZ
MNDHDLLIELKNDVLWLKRYVGAVGVPILLACAKFLLFTTPS